MIKAVIFDLGGVLFSPGTGIAFHRLAKAFPEINPDRIDAIIRNHAISKAYRYGKLTKRQFWNKAAEAAGRKFDTRKFSFIWNSSYTIDMKVLKIVRRLHPHYRLAVLSGNTRERIRYRERKYSFRRYFRVIVCSYMAGVNKPDQRMYDEVVRRLRLDPSECVFIDDSLKCLKPAAAMDMNTIPFSDANALADCLASLGMVKRSHLLTSQANRDS